ncbi:ATP-dependent helicase [Candidatus Omnitrophota bacterium]
MESFLSSNQVRRVKNKIDYNQELNPQQLKAVKSKEGPHLVIAGAGSGKTRILVYRVAYLVEHGVSPDEILLLTFTRRAAQEMLLRATSLLDDRCQRVSGGTFHSFSNLILRQYGEEIGLPKNFTIMDESDAQGVLANIRKNLGFSGAQRRFPRKRALLNIISKCVNKSQELTRVIDEEYPHFLEYAYQIEQVRDEYTSYKQKNYTLDFDDLLVYLRNLLSTRQDICESLARRYRYVMVDEYQDTNKLQAEILYLLCTHHNNIMVVGDDSQSIYSFRGANFKNIIDFPKVYKDAKVVMLEENYRSVQPILDLTNEVIKSAAEKFEKKLFTRRKSKKIPVFIDAKNENGQSKYVVNKIRELVSDGIEPGEIAVLFRAGWHSNDLEIQLASNNIKFQKYGGRKFVEAAHVKDLVSHLRIIQNPSDELSWLRALMLIRNIGHKSATGIYNKIKETKKRFLDDEKLFKKKMGLSRLMELLKRVDPKKQPLLDIVKVMNEYYQPLLKDNYDDYHRRMSDMESLERIASRYSDLEQFLTDMAIEPPEVSMIDTPRRGHDKSKLVLSTIHSAKGLEWHTVFIIYVAEGHIPSYQSFDNDEAIEEERRLLYVAMTRAKENLFMLKPAIDTSGRNFMNLDGSLFTQISRFLHERDLIRDFVDIAYQDEPDEYAYIDV